MKAGLRFILLWLVLVSCGITAHGVAPQIIDEPQSRTNSLGTDATFSVNATGDPPLIYQWYFQGNALGLGIGATLALNNVQSEQAGSYFVVVSNAGGAVTSRVVQLTVVLPWTMFCPYDVMISTDIGQCIATGVTLGSPEIYDNSIPVTVTNDAPAQFPLGQTMVTWTAYDTIGTSNTCIQWVTVLDMALPVVTLNGANPLRAQYGIMFADPGATASDNCASSLPVTVSGNVNVNAFGTYTLTYSATDSSGNAASVSRTVQVVDTTPPTMSCPVDVTVNTDAGQCVATGVSLGSPDVTDNFGAVTVTNNAPQQFALGQTIVTWTAYDANGNTNTCTQRVTVRDLEPPSISCGPILTNTTSQCDQIVNFAPTATNSCGGVNVTCIPPSGAVFPKGQTTVNCTATDTSGNTNSCSFTVQVDDTTLPALACGNVVTNTTGSCNQTVNFVPVVTDNCAVTNVSCLPPSGTRFQVGTTSVRCSAVDSSGNTNRCTFSVTVLDLAPPLLTCPANIVTNAPNGCSQVVTFTPGNWDNCSITNVVCTPPSGSSFALGVTPVTCTATDRSGNSNTCTFSVTVLDNLAPVLTCPNVVTNVTGSCNQIVHFAPTATDNCSVTNFACSPSSGSTFALGATMVSCIAADSSGNTNFCTFSVTVVDLVPPVIVCPSNITEVVGASCQAAVPDVLASLTVSNDCGVTLYQEPTAGTLIGLGTHPITVRATDGQGNSSQCSLQFFVVEPPPTITLQPQSRTNLQGSMATLSITASACTSMSYQWYFGQNLLPDEAAMSLNLSNVQPAQAGDYTVVVSSPGGTSTSAVARITVLVPASIVQEPASLVVTQGNTANFSVTAVGDLPLSYQWFFNETTLVPGATNATLTLSNVQPNQAGSYHVVVTNAFASASSVAAVLTVRQPPFITVQPRNRNLPEGTNYTFSVAAVGEAPLNFQWRFNGANLLNETNTTLALQNLQTNNAGGYQVVVSNSVGVTTSIIAVLTIRRTSDPFYATPENGWTYRYAGDGVASSDGHALDGTWDHKNQSDSWYYDGRGAGNGLAGGVSSTNGILTIEDAVTSGTSDIDNRRIYFTHNLNQEAAVTNASTLLNDGVTLSFRARLTPPPPLDPLTELNNAPNGYVNNTSGRGMFGIRQAGGGGMIISFSLNQPIEDISTSSNWDFAQAGLHMNSLNGNVRSAMVDPNLGGTINLLPLDPTVFHEFWINIQDNGSAPGTHQVTIYIDGSLTPNVFNVTAGTASDVSLLDATSTNYIALGLGNTGQRGAVDVDFFAYKPGILSPMTWNDPVGIVRQPTNQLVGVGQVAVFNVGVTGTPPVAFQWFKNGAPIPNATNATYTTSPTVPSDHGSEIVVVVSNICNLATSAPPAILRLLLPPSIVTQPQDLAVADGASATLSIVVSSEAPVTYQWRFNGANLPQQTNASVYFSSVTSVQAGLYDVLVSNNGGTATSRVARLSIQVFDFGDAPVPYPTLLANNGARHQVQPGIFLGLGVDPELDGKPDALAAAEATDDGVRFATALQAGQIAAIEVVASTNGFLNAWVDFNRNGSWADASEQIFTNQALLPGTNNLSFLVPAWSSATNTFARFRFNTMGNVSFDGPASDGEVEDYTLTLAPVADLGVTILTLPSPVAMGSNLVYTVTVFNTGPSTANAVSLNSQLSPNATVVSMSPSQGNCAPNGSAINCNLGNLGPQSSATVTLTVNATALGVITNRITVAALETDLVTGNNIAFVSTDVLQPPTITLPPTSVTVTQGQSATFTLLAEGAGQLSYQWGFEGTILPGQTNVTLTISSAQPANAGDYQVRIANEVGAVMSAPVSLTVLVPPAIAQQPRSSTNNAGGVILLDVVATGSVPLNYEWHFNGSNVVSTGTNSFLILSNVQAVQSGDYEVLVTNAAGSVLSQSAHLTVLEWDFGDAPDPPYASMQSHNGARHLIRPGFYLGYRVDYEADGRLAGTELDDDGVSFLSPVLVGQTSTVAVVASASGWLNAWVDFNSNGSWVDVGEQIFVNELLAAGTNQLSFVVPVSAQPSISYARFRFSSARNLNSMGDAPDGEVEDYQVTIHPAVDLELQLRDESAFTALGSNMLITLLLTNFGPSPATSVALNDLLPAATEFVAIEPSQGNCSNVNGIVRCDFGTVPAGASVTTRLTLKPVLVGNFTNLASVTSVEADVNPANNMVAAQAFAQEAPAISQQPQSLTVTNGDTAVFSVTATGTDLGYEWYLNGNLWPGVNKPQLRITNVSSTQAGIYTVRVTNLIGSILSEPATLTVLLPAHITRQPQSLFVVDGGTATFQVEVEGTAPVAFQWQYNGNDLLGETQPTLSISTVQPAQAGEYRVRVSNSAGEELSAPAVLTVVETPVISQQPRSQTNYAGRTATLSVVASDTVPLQYQWYSQQNGLLVGATNDALVLSNVQKTAAGDYWVVVSNLAGAVISEVARLTIWEMDFGDAPNSYSTLLAFNGACHALVPGIYLGRGIDFEPDGQPDSNATGDDLNGQGDEDGVRFTNPLYVGQPATLEVVASTNGFLDGWIDYNCNGTWADLEDQVFSSQPLVAGTNKLSFQLPSSAVVSNTFARFRFSTAGGLSFDGPASDGEVEDYALSLLPAADLEVKVAASPSPVPAGSNFTYAVLVTNAGPSRAERVFLTNALPASVGLVSFASGSGSCVNAGNLVICEMAPIGSHEQVALEVVVTAPQRTQSLTNFVSVWSGELDTTPGNNQATLVMPVVGFTEPFVNGELVLLPEYGPAAIYPSTLGVSGVTATVYKVSVTLRNLSHNYPSDLDILLVGPGGQRALLMSGVGAGNSINNVTLTFDDGAAQNLSERITSGEFKPTYRGTPPAALPDPAPAGPYTNDLAVFNGTNPNGVWSLYIADDSLQDGGYLADGWSLQFYTLDPIADLVASQMVDLSPAVKESNLTYTITVTNLGPAGATKVALTDRLPLNAIFVSASTDQGTCTLQDGVLKCTWDNIPSGNVAVAQLVVTPTILGWVTNEVSVTGGELDQVQSNNAGQLITEVKLIATLDPIADVSIDEDAGQQVVSLSGIGSGDPLQPEPVTITAHSSNPSLIPEPVVAYNSLQTTGSLSFVPGPNANGSATITVTVSDAYGTNFPVSRSFQVTVRARNDLPTITPIATQTILEDAGTGLIPFSVGDVEDAPDALVITVASSEPEILPVEGIVLFGSGSNRMVQLTPSTNAFGSALVTLTVHDTQGGSASSTFQLNVTPVNDWPTLDPLLDQKILKNSGQHVVPIAGISSGASNELQVLTLSASATPEGVLGNVQVSYHSPDRSGTLIFETLPDVTGDAMITVTLSDGGASNNVVARTFRVRVNTPPVISPIADLVMMEDTSTDNITYSVTDVESSSALLEVTAHSSNQSLIPDTNIEVLRAGYSGLITLRPLPDAFGTTWIAATVTDSDGGTSNAVFQVTIVPVNDPPTLDAIGDLTINEDAGLQTILLTGITPGPSNELQTLNVTVAVSPSGILTNLQVNYNSPETTGTLSFGTVSNATGTALVTVLVDDGEILRNLVTRSFQVNVLPINDPPMITALADQVIDEDTQLGPITFQVSDLETPAGDLVVGVSSSDPLLVPVANIVLGGSGTNRTVQLLPATNQHGSAVITLRVQDEGGLESTTSFNLLVQQINDLPHLSIINDQVTDEDVPREIPFVIGDTETLAEKLVVSGYSSNPALVPPQNLIFSGSGSNRVLTVLPGSNQFGRAILTVQVRDEDGGVSSRSFELVVNSVNDTPGMDPISDMIIDEDSGPQVVHLTGLFSGSTNELQNLVITAVSSDPSLIPDPIVSYTSAAPAFNTNTWPATNSAPLVYCAGPTNFPSADFAVSGLSTYINADSGARLRQSGVISAVAAWLNPGTNVHQFRVFRYSAPNYTMVSASEWITNNVLGSNYFILSKPMPCLEGDFLGICTRTESAAIYCGNIPGMTRNRLSANGDVTTSSTFAVTNSGMLFLKGFMSAPVIAYAGDSIMAGWTEYYNWMDPRNETLFGNLVHTIPYEVRNLYGVRATYKNYSRGGETYEWVNDVAFPELLRDRPLILVCQAGVNDLAYQRPWSDVLTNLNSIRAQWPRTNKLYICEILPNACDDPSALELRTWNTNLAVWCASNQATLIRLHDYMGQIRPSTGQYDDLVPRYNADGIHLTQAGIDAFASKVAQTASEVQYLDPSSSGTLSFTPATNASGSVTIYVQVNDRQSLNNLYTQSFTVTVQPVNDLPTISSLTDLVTDEDTPTAPLLISIGDVETPASQLTLTARSSNPLLLPETSIVLGGNGDLRTLMLLPAYHQFGTAQITLTVTDAQGGSASNVFNLTVNPVNQWPTLDVIENIIVAQNSGEHTIPVAGITSGASNETQVLTVTASSSRPDLIPTPVISYTSPENSGTLKFTPVPNASGSAVITVTVSDGQATNSSVTRTFIVTVKAVNQLPTLDPIADLTVPENSKRQTVVLTGLSSGATNEFQDLLLAANSSNPGLVPQPTISYTNGSSTAVLSFDLLTNGTGSALITVMVNDGGAENNLLMRTFKVTVTSVNHAPVIGSLPDYSVNEDTATAPMAFSVDDAETPANALTFSAHSSNSILVPDTNIVFGGSGNLRTIQFRPASNQFGTASITVIVTDGAGASATNNFAVTVAAVNDPPTLDALSNLATRADAGPQNLNLTGITSGAPNELETLTVTAISSNPSLVPNPVVNYTSPNATGVLTVTPALNTNGTATITVTVNDGASSNNITTRSFELTVLRVNTAPLIGSITNVTGSEDTVLGPIPFTIGDQENPADSLTITATSSNTNLVPDAGIFISGSDSNPAITLTPSANQSGLTTITLTVRDPEGASASTSFQVTVVPVNDPPLISAIPNQILNEDSSTGPISFLIGDIDNAAAELNVTGNSSNLVLVPVSNIAFGGSGSNRTVTVTPAANQFGTTMITVAISDGLTNTSTNFLVTVNPVNDPPSIATISNQTVTEDTTLAVPFSIGDVDTPLANLSLAISSSNPSLVPANNIFLGGNGSNRTLLITPLPDQNGQSTITVTVNDGSSSNSTSFGLTVTAVNDPPTLGPLVNLTIAQDAGVQTVPLSGITAGPANENNQLLTVTAVSSNPALIPNPTVNYTSPNVTGSLSFTPAVHSNGTAIITVTVNDGQSVSNLASRSFAVTVTPVNIAPTISAIPAQTGDEDTLLTVPFTVGDLESPAAMLMVSSTNSSLVAATNIIFTGTGSNRTAKILPATNQFGTTMITLMVSDGTASSSTSFLLTVNPVNDVPTLDPFLPVFLKYNPGNITVNLTGISSGASNESQTLSVTVTNSNSAYYSAVPVVSYTTPNTNGTVTFKPNGNTSGVGSNMITVTVRDNGTSNNVFTRSFWVYTRPNNSLPPPYASGITNQTTFENTSTGPIAFKVGSTTTPANNIGVFAYSSNPLLLPVSNIVFGGSGSNRTVTLIPADNQTGTSKVTVSVTDTNYGGTNISFNFTVTPVNTLPQISSFTSLAIAEDTSTGPIGFTVSDVETPAGDLIVTATSSNPSLLPDENILLGGSGTNRALMITPATNQTGTATIIVFVNDGTGSSSNSFMLTVNGVNDPPSISSVADQVTNEDTPLTVNFSVTDPETAASSLTLNGYAANPALVANIIFGGSESNRTATVIPATNQVGRTTITLTVTDGNGATASTSFLLTVNPVNDAPIISTIAPQVGNEDAPVGPISFTVGDLEAPAEALVLSATSSNPSLISSMIFGGNGSNRTILLVPAAQQSGTATITVVVSDANGASATNAFLLTLNGVNDPPFISNIPNQLATENTATAPVTFTVGDLETEASILVLVGSSSNPALVPNANISFGGAGSNRTVTVTPAPNQSGTAMITVTVTDANSASSSASFNLRVVATNHPPVISDIPDLFTAPGVPTRAIGFSIGDSVTPSELLVLTATSADTAIVPNANIIFGGSSSNRTITVQPLANQIGDATITVVVHDTNGTSVADSFVLHVTPPLLPLVFDIPDQRITENIASGPLSFTIANVRNSSALGFAAQSSNPALIPTENIVFGGIGTNRTLTVTPAPNQFGNATITITATETNGGAGTDIFVVQVAPVNYPPTISQVADQTIPEDASLGPISFTVDDAETAAGWLIVSASSSNPALLSDANIGIVGSGSNRTVTLIPSAHQSGTARVTLLVTDGVGATASTSFLLTVTPINYPPTISRISDRVINEDSSTGTIPFSVYDLETAASNLVVSAVSTNQSLVPDAHMVLGGNGNTRTVLVSPAPDQFGTTLVTLTVTDGNGATASTTFLVTVNPVNDLPNISALADQTVDEDTPMPATSFSVGDLETPPADLVVNAYSSNPTLTSEIILGGSGTNRTIAIIPAPNQSGTATITITVTDSNNVIASNHFVLTVRSVNDLPQISSVPDQVTDENVPTMEIPFTIGDVETPATSLLVLVTSSNPMLIPDNQILLGGNGSNRTVKLVPALNRSGSALITLTVVDGQDGVTSRTFAFSVDAINQPPSISTIADQIVEEGGHTGQIPFVVRDAETPASQLVLGVISSNPVLVPNDQIQITGNGINRVLTINHVANQFGTARITVTVTDGGGASADSSFDVTVNSVNDLPVISPIAAQTTDENTPTAPIVFVIGDIETPSSNLVLSAQSSNPVLVPPSGLVFSGYGSNRSLTIAPALGQYGTAVITLIVTDTDGGQGSNSFTFTVNQTIFPPVITSQPQGQSVVAGGAVSLTVTATGTEPLSYQWQHEGVALPDQTNSTLRLANVQPAQAGNYRVFVSNSQGAVSSDVAWLRVVCGPTISIFRTNGIAVIRFATLQGLQYTIEYKNALDAPSWNALDFLIGNGEVAEIQDAGAKLPVRFYRVRVE